MVQLVECPRDAMQGLTRFIPTNDKIRYLNVLLNAGFHTLDFGSFVSPKAIPQMRDTHEVLAGLELDKSPTKLLAIVANLRGAEAACDHSEIDFLGYPYSISETFQMRNTNRSITEATTTLARIQDCAGQFNKSLVVYLSMGFGNPYGDPFSEEIAAAYTEKLVDMGIHTISLSDTIGAANEKLINDTYTLLSKEFPDVAFGIHLHARPDDVRSKVLAAYQAGCRRFDSAIRGFGGCPMAADELVGNVATETLIQTLEEEGEVTGIHPGVLSEGIRLSTEILY